MNNFTLSFLTLHLLSCNFYFFFIVYYACLVNAFMQLNIIFFFIRYSNYLEPKHSYICNYYHQFILAH